MRRVSAIPEDIELDMGDEVSSDGQDLRMLVDELKDAISKERPGERALANSARELTRMAGAMRNQTATAGAGTDLRLGVFVDTANVTDRDPDDPIRIDFKKLLDEVTADRRLIHARAYCPIYA
ncbi:MAG: hypothetical protein OXI70_07150, partial [Chloroflexota bacterium]|nr:hypothetical protein [Chloroflexota bacterium]